MEKCTVTIKKDFYLNGHKCFSGNSMDIYVGSNVTTERFNELLEIGAIELGTNLEFMKQKGVEHGIENLADRKDSD